jgi:hypothetical protein
MDRDRDRALRAPGERGAWLVADDPRARVIAALRPGAPLAPQQRPSLRDIARLAPLRPEPAPPAPPPARAYDPPRARPVPPRRLRDAASARPASAPRRSDPDDAFARRALVAGHVPASVLARCRARLEQERARGGPAHLAQLLVHDGHLTAAQFVEIADDLGRPIYECPRCGTLHRRAELDRAGRVACRGCGAELDARGAGLSRLEILVSHDPRELSVVLRELPGV